MYLGTEEMITVDRQCTNCGKTWKMEVDRAFADLMGSGKLLYGYCDECAKKVKEAEELLEKAEAEDRLLSSAGIPKDFRNYDNTRGNYALAKKIWSTRRNSMIVCGPNDTGKTRALTIALVWSIKEGCDGKFIRFSELAARYAAICRESLDDAYDFIRRTLDTGTLLIDDVGKRRITETAGELLYEIFDRVYSGDAACRLWLTINDGLLELGRKFENRDVGNAVVSRIDRMITAGRMTKWSA